MKNIKTYDEQYRTILNNNVATISENLVDEDSFNEFMTTDFTKMFEDVILNGTVILLLEGQNWDKVKGWLKDKWSDLKKTVSEFIQKIGQVINSSVLGKFIEAIRNKFKELSQDVLDFFDTIKIAVIKHNLILDNNKPNFKKITEYVMEICKSDKKADSSAIDSISNAASGLKSESLFISNDSLVINENLNFVNASLNELWGWNKPKTPAPSAPNPNKKEPSAPPSAPNPNKKEPPAPSGGAPNPNKKEPTSPGTTPAPGKTPAPSPNQAPAPDTNSGKPADTGNIIFFNVPKQGEEGQTVNTEQLANTGVGIFTKLLLKIGVKSDRSQVVLSKIGVMLMGLIVSTVIALVASTGIGLAITGTAGWAFAGVGFSIVTVIAGLFFAFGVFLLMCWFRKPYPSLEDYQEYLEAWFKLYPDGKRRPENKKGNAENFKGETREGWGKYDENRLKKDDTCTLLRKWNRLKTKGENTEANQTIIKNIEAHLLKRNLKPEQFEAERQKCKEKVDQPTGRMVSYRDKETGKARVGIQRPTPKPMPKNK